MKYLMALFVATLLVQPVPAETCDMENGQDSMHHAAMVDHQTPECCEQGSDEGGHGCIDLSACGSCNPGPAFVQALTAAPLFTLARHFAPANTDILAAKHHHPPFRPPIS